MEKGKTNNPNGRPKGKPNKATADMRDFITGLLTKNRRQLESDFTALEPADRWRIAEKLMAFIIPKQKSVDANINFEAMSDEQLDVVIHGIVTNMREDEDAD